MPLTAGLPGGSALLKARHGVKLYSPSPPDAAGAKYPSMSASTSAASETMMEMSPPFAAAGTIAAFAVVVPVVAFRVETPDHAWSLGHVARKFSVVPWGIA